MAWCLGCRQKNPRCPPKRMRRATVLRKASDCRYRAESQRGGTGGLCWQYAGRVVIVRLNMGFRLGGCEQLRRPDITNKPLQGGCHGRMLLLDAERSQKRVFWLSCFEVGGGEGEPAAAADKRSREHVNHYGSWAKRRSFIIESPFVPETPAVNFATQERYLFQCTSSSNYESCVRC